MPVPDILKPIKLQTISIVMVKIISQISSDIGIDNKHRPLEYKNEKISFSSSKLRKIKHTSTSPQT